MLMHVKSLLLSMCCIGLASAQGLGQARQPDAAELRQPFERDTLPAITMKFEPAYLILWVVVPGAGLFLGGHSYEINGRKRSLASSVAPYFRATGDAQLSELYKASNRNRILWYTLSATGGIVGGVGFAHGIASIFNPEYSRSASTYLLTGAGLLAGGLAARVVCFRKLRRAINLYNYQYASPRQALSLKVGLSAQTAMGLGVSMKF